MENNTKAILLALICTAIVSVAQIFLKQGSDAFSLSLDQIYNYPLLAGVVLYFAGAVVLIYAFRLGELSVVYPVMASSYVIVTILSSIYLQEPIIPQKWIGISLITLGVIIIGRGGKS
ncbi:EamA family transporter [Candidatus Woesearchaeota archaeon]|nr:EamA family transporter [Candidatus Woesearchaeota archaeon]